MYYVCTLNVIISKQDKKQLIIFFLYSYLVSKTFRNKPNFSVVIKAFLQVKYLDQQEFYNFKIVK